MVHDTFWIMQYKTSKGWEGGWLNDVFCTTLKGRMPSKNAGKDNPCKSHDHTIPSTLETAYDCVLSINYFYHAKNI